MDNLFKNRMKNIF